MEHNIIGKNQDRSISEFIKSIDMFSHLEPEDLQAIVPAFIHREIPAGEEIFDQDEPAREILLIIKGRVRIFRRGEDGREVILATLKKGDFFGEIAIFTGAPRSAAAVAIEPTTLLFLPRDKFLKTILSSPHMGLKILEELSRRLLQADRTIASLLWDNAYQKILLNIQRLIETEGETKGDAVVIKRRVTHQEIADMAGTSRETASRILAYLKKLGAVVPSGRNIIIREALIPPSFKQ